MTIDPINKERLESLAGLGADFDATKYQPGTHGCHELLHMLHITVDMVQIHCLDHPASILNEHWYRKITEARDHLMEAYKAVGEAHLANGTPTAKQQNILNMMMLGSKYTPEQLFVDDIADLHRLHELGLIAESIDDTGRWFLYRRLK